MPEGDVARLGFVVVDAGSTAPAAYPRLRAGDGSGRFDFIWFTPRVDDADPCEKFAPAFKQRETGTP